MTNEKRIAEASRNERETTERQDSDRRQVVRCSVCHDRGYYEVDKGHTLELIPCKCLPGVRQCCEGHTLVVFRALECPMCSLKRQVTYLREEMRRLRGLQRTSVQIKQEKQSEALRDGKTENTN